VIREQQRRVTELDEGAIAATQELKNDAVLMKEALLKGNIREVAQVLGRVVGREEKNRQRDDEPRDRAGVCGRARGRRVFRAPLRRRARAGSIIFHDRPAAAG